MEEPIRLTRRRYSRGVLTISRFPGVALARMALSAFQQSIRCKKHAIQFVDQIGRGLRRRGLSHLSLRSVADGPPRSSAVADPARRHTKNNRRPHRAAERPYSRVGENARTIDRTETGRAHARPSDPEPAGRATPAISHRTITIAALLHPRRSTSGHTSPRAEPGRHPGGRLEAPLRLRLGLQSLPGQACLNPSRSRGRTGQVSSFAEATRRRSCCRQRRIRLATYWTRCKVAPHWCGGRCNRGRSTSLSLKILGRQRAIGLARALPSYPQPLPGAPPAPGRGSHLQFAEANRRYPQDEGCLAFSA